MSAETIVFIALFSCKKKTPSPFLWFHDILIYWNKTKCDSGDGEGSTPPLSGKTKACCRTEEGNYKNLNNQYYKRKKKKICDVTVMWVLPYFITMLANRADVNENMYKYIYKVLML